MEIVAPCLAVCKAEGLEVARRGEPVVETVGGGGEQRDVSLIGQLLLPVGEMGVATIVFAGDTDGETYGVGVIDLGIVAGTCRSPTAAETRLVCDGL